MFLRFLQLNVKAGRVAEFRTFFDGQVVAALQSVAGCEYAGLAQNIHDEEIWISITLWRSRADAEAYQQGEVYRGLIEQSRPFFPDSSEWKLQLTDDFQLDYKPVPSEPVMRAYAEPSPSLPDPQDFSNRASHFSTLRLMSLHVSPGRIGEFTTIYNREIVPALHAVPGCRGAFLTQSTNDTSELLSVTLWDDHLDAEAYEGSGTFDHLKKKIRHTLSGLSQWKIEADEDPGSRAVSSEDIEAKSYRMVSGKALQKP